MKEKSIVGKSFSRIGLAASLWLLLTPLILHSQTVKLVPSCAKPGVKVCITGSGWAEPNPVCRYTFALDGTSVAPDQPDGLFGPPNGSFIVPAIADGSHTIRVQLRQNSPDTLLQEQTASLKVQTGGTPLSAAFPGGAEIDVTFDPSKACGVSSCSKIGFVQVMRQVGTKADGTTRTVLPNEITGFDDTGERTKSTTPNSFGVDRLPGKKEPYYGGNGTGTGHWTPGSSDGTNFMSATMDDAPNSNPANWPADITQQLTREFETAVFCVAGTDEGKFLGTFRWKYDRPAGSAGVSSLVTAPSDTAPSADFTSALSLWVSNHSSFTLPKATAQCQ